VGARFALCVILSLVSVGVFVAGPGPHRGVRCAASSWRRSRSPSALRVRSRGAGDDGLGMLEGWSSHRRGHRNFHFGTGVEVGPRCVVRPVVPPIDPQRASSFARWPALDSSRLASFKGLFGVSRSSYLFAEGEQNRLITYGTRLVCAGPRTWRGTGECRDPHPCRTGPRLLAVLETPRCIRYPVHRKGFGSFLIMVSAVVCLGGFLRWVDRRFLTPATSRPPAARDSP